MRMVSIVIVALAIIVFLIFLFAAFRVSSFSAKSREAPLETRTTLTVDRCVSCGEIIPEGRMVCSECEIKASRGG